ncbi:sialin isoform X2 [Sitodiplosis mosellana]|uniref:sialin isoform X2 n=1 Tax=Sitodiplosis mosellana TaxID=263140 RepID=UPI002444B42B|nr:sialin isoform X2 [Sitodiplosis mosellana]
MEKVISVPTDESENIEIDAQPTDETERIDDEKGLLQNTKTIVADHNMKSENEDEQHLVPHSPVYQKTVESSPKKINLISSTIGSITSLKSFEKTSTIKCRTILWYMSFVGFMVNYIYRLNVNIAIVEMVAKKTSATSSYHPSECVVAFNQTINSSAVQVYDFPVDYSTKFEWDELDQSRVLGSFFWLHWTLQIVGGILASCYGTKAIFGLSNFVSCFLCFFIPMAAKFHVNLLIAIRVAQGIISGLAWPAMHHLASQWIPPDERSTFITSYLGSSVAIAFFYPAFGFILSIWSWESVFYLSGIFGSVWYVAWLYFVYDSPDQHPRIDPAERDYIEKSLGGSFHAGDQKTPWKSILRSSAVWVNICGQFGGLWGLFTMMTQAPTYFRVIHGWGVQMTGILSGIPHLCRMVFAYFFSIFVDSLLRKQVMSRTNVRKLAGGVATIFNGLFVLALAYSGCSSTAAVVFLTLSTSLHGAVSAGPLASLIDISPNFSGITLGLNGVFCVSPGFISPWIVGRLTHGNQSIQQWQYVFLICAAVLLFCGAVYVLFADSTLQSWNQPETTSKSNKDKEMKVIKSTTQNDLDPVRDCN